MAITNKISTISIELRRYCNKHLFKKTCVKHYRHKTMKRGAPKRHTNNNYIEQVIINNNKYNTTDRKNEGNHQ